MSGRRVALGRPLGIVAAVLLAVGPAGAGDGLWARGELTGDWGGARPKLADRGIGLDLDFTGFGVGLLSGTGEEAFEASGRGDAFLTFDAGKLGLWKGGRLSTHFEYRGGKLPPSGGALWPASTGTFLPLDARDELVMSTFQFSQTLGRATLIVGKINVVDLLAGDPFFGGWGTRRFMNVALVAPPSGLLPPVIMGAIATYAARPWSLTAMAYDPNDRTRDYFPGDLFDDGVNLSLAGAWSGAWGGRPSNLALSGTYSTREGTDLSDVLLPPDLEAGTKAGSWSLGIQGGHLLVPSPALPGRGLGVYLRALLADGNPNPIRAAVKGGFAGQGVVPGRERDTFGVGYYYYAFSDALQSAVSPVAEFDDEQGLEVYYSLAATPWFRLTADLQVVNPASGASRTAVTGAVRANVVF
jgi:porin